VRGVRVGPAARAAAPVGQSAFHGWYDGSRASPQQRAIGRRYARGTAATVLVAPAVRASDYQQQHEHPVVICYC
jgi:hypothetical protein